MGRCRWLLLSPWALHGATVEGRDVRRPLAYPRFEAQPLLTPAQCRKVRRRAASELQFTEATVGSGSVGSHGVKAQRGSRRAKFAGVPKTSFFYSQVYRLLWDRINATNEKLWRFAIAPGTMEFMQYSIYAASDLGGYSWHEDVGFHSETASRALSVSVQLSEGAAYEAKFWADGKVRYSQVVRSRWDFPRIGVNASRDAGQAIMFPSHVTHRVTPVTRGERHSLVLWLQLDTGSEVDRELPAPVCNVQVASRRISSVNMVELTYGRTDNCTMQDSIGAFVEAHGFPAQHQSSVKRQLGEAMTSKCGVL
ncbi:hypothetical protein AK812_SmicGene23907 [Symbiodinium microadriaticum]|uniref:Fe2OG dioxygenase domain-containing protein n=1 Tax=Symbiodinium microadriaticum TaxID=2951 RepID=A0A1Q9DG05_SYMMI|nr:hypothetical protein AK812_SmicGene23907 [Symbiodinium microadriaticum]